MMVGEGESPEKNLNSLIHVAAVVFGSITGKGDDMICLRQDRFSYSQRERVGSVRTS